MTQLGFAELIEFFEKENFVFELKDQSLIRVSGKDHIKFLNGISSNEVENLPQGESTYSLILTNKGKILFDICLFKINDSSMYIQTNSNQIDSLIKHIAQYKMSLDVEVDNLSEKYTIFKNKSHNIESKISFNSPLPLEENFRIIFIEKDHKKIFQSPIIDDKLYVQWKIINGVPSYPYEINSRIIPIEANMWSAISFIKGCYIGQEIIARIRYKGQVKRTLACIKSDKDIKINDAVHNSQGKNIGQISSKTYISNDNCTFALGFVDYSENIDENKIFLLGNEALVVKNNYQIENIKNLEL
ncbi:MAG: hypothetical protein VYB18_02625 [Thermodesulfobacteriota bacterium]|nr:hypothetical protein [Thermodesulfobacteriota bacterium]